MRRRLALSAAVTAVAAAAVTAAPAAPTTWTHGYDVSWPQCSGASATRVPGGQPAYVVLGLTHGRGHTRNPCLSAQVSWARAAGARIGAYLVPSYPSAAQLRAAGRGAYGTCGSTQRTCRLRNDGAAQAADALAAMRAAGLSVPLVWVDVEFRRPHPWSAHDARNRAVLTGVLRGLADAGVAAGVYTTGYMWERITGGWRLAVPNWVPAGDGKAAAAKAKCGTSATGGPAWLVQYTRRFDEDLTCPVMDAVPGRPGPLWRYRHTTQQLGARGAAVRALQRQLHVTVTGNYDLATTTAVVQFQHAHALPVDGRVDSDDWRAMGAFRRTGGHPFLLGRMTTR